MSVQENLFSEFPPVSAEKWKRKIEEDLKESFENLIQSTEEGFDLNPFYTKEEIEPLDIPLERQIEGWQIRRDFLAENYNEANKKVLSTLENGVDCIGIRLKGSSKKEDLELLLKNVPLNKIPIHFLSDEKTELASESFIAIVEGRKISSSGINGSFNLDPLCDAGNANYNSLKKLLQTIHEKLPRFKALTIHSQTFPMEGKNVVEELSEIMNKVQQYWSGLSVNNYPLSTFVNQVQFSVPIGPDYFLEIAKLRALRWLWNDWQKKNGAQKPFPAFIQVPKSSKFNDAEDPYHNILLHTTGAMAAVIGGCDVLNLQSTEKTERLDNDFFSRISGNIQLILKHEAHFDKVVDPARGSYYLEVLTGKLIESVKKITTTNDQA